MKRWPHTAVRPDGSTDAPQLGWRRATPRRLQDGRGIALSLKRGDSLRCDAGLAWITQLGHAEDRFLQPGQTLTVSASVDLWVSGLPTARLVHIAGEQSVDKPATEAQVPAWRTWLRRGFAGAAPLRGRAR